MKWATAVGQVERMVDECARMAGAGPTSSQCPVVQLWVTGSLLGAPRDVDWVDLAIAVDLPAEKLPWGCTPRAARAWSDLTRMSKNPISASWRSIHAPLWNHDIDAAVLVWDSESGARPAALGAIKAGDGRRHALVRPSGEEYVTRIQDELRISLDELRRRTAEYDVVPTTERLGVRGDALHRAARAYLEVLEAVEQATPHEAGTAT